MSNTLTSLLYRVGNDLPAVIVELLLIGLCVNWCASVLQSTRGTRPLRGVLVILIVVTMAVRILVARFGWVRLELLYSYILLGMALIALVVFQPELRRAVIRIGDVRFRRRRGPQSQLVAALVKSAGFLSRNHYGALIAIQRDVDLTGWAENGTLIRAEVSANLLNTIFFPNSPLHDLGVIIRGTRVVAANCQFPSPDSDEIDAALGSRHLAAVGMSYETDALVLVVSEETGVISLADNGKLSRYLTLDDLDEELTTRLGSGRTPQPAAQRRNWGSAIWRHIRRVLVVVPLTVVIWYLTDQATFLDASVKLRLNLHHDDPSYIVDIVEPLGTLPGAPEGASGRPIDQLHTDAVVFEATFRGPAREIDRLPTPATGRTLELDWVLRKTDTAVGMHELSPWELKDKIEGFREIQARGLTVQEDTLRILKYSVDRRITLRMRVQPDAGDTPISTARVEPSEATVVFRAHELQRFLGVPPEPSDLERFVAERAVRAQVGEQLAELEPEELGTFEATLDTRVSGIRTAAITPKQVEVTVSVVGQRRTISNVVVQLFVSPEVAAKYRVERPDPNEWRIDVEVIGKEASVRQLGPAAITAFVHITSDMLPEPGGDTLRLQEVTVLAPDGVRVVTDKPRTVRVNIVPQGAAVP